MRITLTSMLFTSLLSACKLFQQTPVEPPADLDASVLDASLETDASDASIELPPS